MTVTEALAAYDAAPRIEAKFRVAYVALREACLAAGMPPHPARVVPWARDHVKANR